TSTLMTETIMVSTNVFIRTARPLSPHSCRFNATDLTRRLSRVPRDRDRAAPASPDAVTTAARTRRASRFLAGRRPRRDVVLFLPGHESPALWCAARSQRAGG